MAAALSDDVLPSPAHGRRRDLHHLVRDHRAAVRLRGATRRLSRPLGAPRRRGMDGARPRPCHPAGGARRAPGHAGGAPGAHGGALPHPYEPDRSARGGVADDRHRAHRGQVGGNAAGPIDAGARRRRPLRRAAGATRFVLRRRRRVRQLPDRQRLVEAVDPAQAGGILRRRLRTPCGDPDRPLPPASARGVPAAHGVLRILADHRALQLPAGGRLRQRVRREVRERLPRQPGRSRYQVGGLRGRGAHRLRLGRRGERVAVPGRPGAGRTR